MKYIALDFREHKPCIVTGCEVPAQYMIVSAYTLRRRRKHPEYGVHYYVCVDHKPAKAVIAPWPHSHASGLITLTPRT